MHLRSPHIECDQDGSCRQEHRPAARKKASLAKSFPKTIFPSPLPINWTMHLSLVVFQFSYCVRPEVTFVAHQLSHMVVFDVKLQWIWEAEYRVALITRKSSCLGSIRLNFWIPVILFNCLVFLWGLFFILFIIFCISPPSAFSWPISSSSASSSTPSSSSASSVSLCLASHNHPPLHPWSGSSNTLDMNLSSHFKHKYVSQPDTVGYSTG